ncbi:caspase family protein [Streptomyces sp. NPDC097981]|uniref:caspase family protein n=1 Tax=Streptomyces sp. NPDC097981 TaxID=3155428 RepID=UPI0033245698
MNGPSVPALPSARAVLIGTAAYASGDLRPIPHSRRNIRGLAAVLAEEARGGLTAWDVKLVDDPLQPEEIMRPVTAAAEEAEDALLVYYSGHGLLARDDGDFHVTLTASDPDKPWTSLPYSYVADPIRKSRAKVKIVITDCCYSGRAHADLMGSESRLITEQLRAKGVYSLSSAPADRRSLAPKGDEYSAFTGFLLAAVRDGVPGAEPVLGLTDLFLEVRRRMRGAGLPLPEECSKAAGAGAYPFVRNRAPRPPAPDPEPAPVPRAPERPAAPARVNAPLDEAIAVAAGPDRWVEALRLVLTLQGLARAPRSGRLRWGMRGLPKRCGMTEGEQLIGYATTSRSHNVVFTDTHLCVLNSPELLRVPYSRLSGLTAAVSTRTERVVTVTDQGGSSEDVLLVTTAATFGGRTVKLTESGGCLLQKSLTECVPALVGLRERNPGWFA